MFYCYKQYFVNVFKFARVTIQNLKSREPKNIRIGENFDQKYLEANCSLKDSFPPSVCAEALGPVNTVLTKEVLVPAETHPFLHLTGVLAGH